jgi:predicted TIM-barrel fold metal-dependent hydrolase
LPTVPAQSAKSVITLPPGSVDAHAHVFTRELRLAPNARYVPEADAPIERYLNLLDAHGLAAGILVQPSFLGTDNDYLIASLARVPARLRGVAVVSPDTPPASLERLRTSGVAGIRLNLIGQPPPNFAASPWREFLVAVARAGLHVEIQAEGETWREILDPLLASGCRLVIDHFGRPTRNEGPRCLGFQTLVAAARSADIWFKLSAPYRLVPATAAWSCAALLLKIPGIGRLVWGSDWPWTQHPEITRYADTIDWLSEWVPDAGARAQVLGANARTLYGFNKPLNVAAPPWKRL